MSYVNHVNILDITSNELTAHQVLPTMQRNVRLSKSSWSFRYLEFLLLLNYNFHTQAWCDSCDKFLVFILGGNQKKENENRFLQETKNVAFALSVPKMKAV